MAAQFDVRVLIDDALLLDVVAALDARNGYSLVPSALAALGGGPFSNRLIPRVPPAPAWLWCDTGDQVIVAASGISTPGDGLGVFASTLQPLSGPQAWKALASAVSVAQGMLAELRPLFLNGPRRWVLSGHSYGGALLAALAGLLGELRAVEDLQLLTFGSPRPGDSSLASYLTRYTVRRLMNTGDPVPRFPPHLTEAPTMTLLVPFGVALQWSRYLQPAGGLVLGNDGGLVVAELPAATLPVADAELLSWALSDRCFYATAHRVGEYQRRLSLAVAGSQSFTSSTLPGSRPEASAELTQQAFQAAAAVASAVLTSLEVRPMAQGYIPPDFRAKAVRLVTGDYGVQWFTGTIMMGHNRTNARSLANKLNLFLRVMQGAASADHTAFNAALASYWTVCTEASLGFNPPLVVT